MMPINPGEEIWRAPRRPAYFHSRARASLRNRGRSSALAAAPVSGTLSCTWSCKQPSDRTRLTWTVEETVLGFSSSMGCSSISLLFWTTRSTASYPVSPGSLRYQDASDRSKAAVFLPGEHAPLHRDCNTIFPLWGCERYSAKPCLKTSFIIHRLQTEIIFDNLCRKQAAFWLLASRLKGGNTCSLSDEAPGESTDNLLTRFPRERAQMFLWNKITTLS